MLFDEIATLIAGIVQDNRDRQTQGQGRQFIKQLAYAQRVDVRGIGDRNDLFGHGIECTQDVEALTTRGRPNPDPRKTPQQRSESAKDKVCCVYTKDGSLARCCLRQTGLKFFFLKAS